MTADKINEENKVWDAKIDLLRAGKIVLPPYPDCCKACPALKSCGLCSSSDAPASYCDALNFYDKCTRIFGEEQMDVVRGLKLPCERIAR